MKFDSRRTNLAACCVVHGLQDGLGAALYVLLPVLAQVFGLSYSQIGIIRAATNTAMAIFEIPSGVLAERYGERVLLAFGLACAGVGFLLLPLSQGFVGLTLCLLIAGVGAAFQHALSSAIVVSSFDAHGRRGALGVYNAAGDAGKLALAAASSVAIGIGVSWQGIAVGFGMTAILGACVLLYALRLTGAGGALAGSHPHTAKPVLAPGWGINDRSGFAILSAITSLVSLVQGTFLTFIAFIMIEKDVPTHLAASAVVLTLIGGMVGKFACGFLAGRFGIVRSLILVQLLTALCLVGVLGAPTLIGFCLLPIVGVFLQGSSSITYATVSDFVDSGKQSRGFALIYSLSSAASILGPVCFGYIGDVHGLAPAMLGMVVLVLLPLVLCGGLRQALLRTSVEPAVAPQES